MEMISINSRTQKGLLTELYCQKAFTELGIMLSAPIMSDSRYDFIADIQGNLIKIQCKTCSYDKIKNVIIFSTKSTRGTSSGNFERKYTKNEIDYFYTYYNNISYLIPVEECSATKTLNLKEKILNENTKNINFAEDYELKTMLQKIFSYEEKEIELTKVKEAENYCIDCNKPILKTSTRCKSCASKNVKNFIFPVTRDELKYLIRTESFVSLGKKYNRTDNAIKKWCKKFNLPSTKKEINNYTDEEWNNI